MPGTPDAADAGAGSDERVGGDGAPGRHAVGDAPGADLFDDDYVRLLAPFHTEAAARRETAAVRELLGLAQSDRILDLGCGWGRHLALLVRAGHRVVGVDLSPVLLRRARDAMAPAAHPDPPADGQATGGAPAEVPGEPPGEVAPTALLAAADMRALPFPDSSFDVVLNLASSLGLFLSDGPAERALAEARRVLTPGGRLLLEGMHRDDVVAHFAAGDAWTLDDGTRVRARRRFDALAGVSHEVLRWEGPRGGGSKRHSLRIRSATEIARLIHAAGLVVERAHGDWTGEPFRPDSERLLVVARAGRGPAG